jgi:Phage gp6-like head-tail connector protein
VIADLDSVVVLSTEARDTAGDPVATATATLTVTAPDGTATAPAVTPDGNGGFSATLTADQPGLWTFRWSSPDSVSLTVSAGQVSVADPERVLIAGLDEFKKQLDIDPDDYSQDGELRLYLEAATNQVEWLIGPVTPTVFIERHSSWDLISLDHQPVIDVVSVTAVVDGVLTSTALDPGLYFGNQYGGIRLFQGYEQQDYEIEYVAGYTDIRADMKLAGLIIAQHLWQIQNGRWTINAPSDDQMATAPGSGFSVPWRAMELLRPYMSVMVAGGIA